MKYQISDKQTELKSHQLIIHFILHTYEEEHDNPKHLLTFDRYSCQILEVIIRSREF